MNRSAHAAMALVAAGGCATRGAEQIPGANARPKLIVQIVMDQMRADYVPRYRAQWTQGLHRLMTEGAYFSNAQYPYAGTVTCARHASIGTGTVPSVHGMVLNEWWDRSATRTLHVLHGRGVTRHVLRLDRRVPVILFGSPFKAGRFEGPASPLDIAATWARLTGVALDRPHGRSLDAAVKD